MILLELHCCWTLHKVVHSALVMHESEQVINSVTSFKQNQTTSFIDNFPISPSFISVLPLIILSSAITMSEVPALLSDDHVDSNFGRDGPFRFFDLPTEVRDQILRLLLIRGNIALGKKSSIRKRFSGWSHERPMWQLLSVNGRLREEASAVLFSPRYNTFYLPIGISLIDARWWTLSSQITSKVVPAHVKEMDVAFDMRDFEETPFNIFEEIKREHDGTNAPRLIHFEQLTTDERHQMIHDRYRTKLMDVWHGLAQGLGMMSLDLLRVDVSKARCPLGCCRLADVAVFVLKHICVFPDPLPFHHTRFEILGALHDEKGMLREIIGDSAVMRNDDFTFVDMSGCICDVSPRGTHSFTISLANNLTVQTDPANGCKG